MRLLTNDLLSRAIQKPKLLDTTGHEEISSPKRKFWAGCPCGHPVKHFGQTLQVLEHRVDVHAKISGAVSFCRRAAVIMLRNFGTSKARKL